MSKPPSQRRIQSSACSSRYTSQIHSAATKQLLPPFRAQEGTGEPGNGADVQFSNQPGNLDRDSQAGQQSATFSSTPLTMSSMPVSFLVDAGWVSDPELMLTPSNATTCNAAGQTRAYSSPSVASLGGVHSNLDWNVQPDEPGSTPLAQLPAFQGSLAGSSGSRAGRMYSSQHQIAPLTAPPPQPYDQAEGHNSNMPQSLGCNRLQPVPARRVQAQPQLQQPRLPEHHGPHPAARHKQAGWQKWGGLLQAADSCPQGAAPQACYQNVKRIVRIMCCTLDDCQDTRSRWSSRTNIAFSF